MTTDTDTYKHTYIHIYSMYYYTAYIYYDVKIVSNIKYNFINSEIVPAKRLARILIELPECLLRE